MRHAVAPGLQGRRVRPRHVQALHHHVARAHAVNGRWQLRGNFLAIDIDDQRCFFRIVEALAHTHAEERGILLHEALGSGCEEG